MKHRLDNTCALIAVDVQSDFCPGGALPVPEGDAVVELLNAYTQLFAQAGAMIIATRDWHPPDHCSFKSRGGPWPPHCVQGTSGAEFHPRLHLPKGTLIVSKAENPTVESYSFFGNAELERLLMRGIRRVFIGGLATDYCVRWTALDAVKRNFETWLLTDAVKAVDVRPGDGDRAVEEMIQAGVKLTQRNDFTTIG